jgi:NAD(P)-dependent dehydrogenase (short-subunit alcohol dehydrogenase family)
MPLDSMAATSLQSVAVVTGATRGLGLALARGLAVSGTKVIITARDQAAAAATAESIRRDYEGAIVHAYGSMLDVSDANSLAAFAQFAADDLDGVDLLINNAAACPIGWGSREAVSECWRTNVMGPLALARALLPDMLQRGRGHVVSVSSGDGELVYLHTALQAELRAATSARAVLRVLARCSPPHEAFGRAPAHGPTPAYSISKAALNALTRVIAAQLPPPEISGVRVSAVCPGDVLTRMCVDEEARAGAVLPETAADDVLWLCAAGLDADADLLTGSFWRHRRQIDW